MRDIFLLIIVSSTGCIALHKNEPDDGGTYNYSYNDPNNPSNENDAGQNPIPSNNYDGGQVQTNKDSGQSSPTNYGPWSNCFNPSEAYPTGVLKYPNCASFCQSIGKNISSSCIGPDPSDNATFVQDDTLIWCGMPDGTCGDILQYPDYIASCFQPSVPNPPVCIIGMNRIGTNSNEWITIAPCNGASIGSVPTSAQCCCQ